MGNTLTFYHSVAGVAIIHVVYVYHFEKSSHPSLAMVPTIVIAQTELCWSLVSATIPNLKNFMKSFSTGFGHEFGLGTITSGYMMSGGSQNANRGNNIQLSNMSKQRSNTDSPRKFASKLDRSGNAYDIEVSRGRQHDAQSVGSGKSQEMIIRKDVTITQDHGNKQRKKVLF